MAAGARRIQNIILWCTLAHLSELVLLDVALTSAGANAGAGISDSEKMATSSMPCHWRGAPQHTAVGWALLAFDWLGRGSPVILLLLASQPRPWCEQNVDRMHVVTAKMIHAKRSEFGPLAA